jgi:hypothetical protein
LHPIKPWSIQESDKALGIGGILEEQPHHKAELRTNPEHRPHDYFRQGIFEGAEEGVEELLSLLRFKFQWVYASHIINTVPFDIMSQ